VMMHQLNLEHGAICVLGIGVLGTAPSSRIAPSEQPSGSKSA
jgi:hypothetical protein